MQFVHFSKGRETPECRLDVVVVGDSEDLLRKRSPQLQKSSRLTGEEVMMIRTALIKHMLRRVERVRSV